MIAWNISKVLYLHRWHPICLFVIFCGVYMLIYVDLIFTWQTCVFRHIDFVHKYVWLKAYLYVCMFQNSGSMRRRQLASFEVMYSNANQIEQQISIYLHWYYNTPQLFWRTHNMTNFTILEPRVLTWYLNHSPQ